MTAVALVLAALAAALHVFIWTMESLTWRQPATWRRFGLASQADADVTAPMAYNQGYYNLFLAITTLVGVVFVAAGDDDAAGWALVISGCAMMLGAALVLATTGKAYRQAAVIQGVLPLFAVVTGIIAAS